jgi:hypothetical protein
MLRPHPFVLAQGALLLQAGGEAPAARDLVRQAWECVDVASPYLRTASLALLGVAADALGERDVAAACRERLEPLRGCRVVLAQGLAVLGPTERPLDLPLAPHVG